MQIYIVATSERSAFRCFLTSEYYENYEEAMRDLNEFRKHRQKIWRIDIPIELMFDPEKKELTR